MRKAFLMITDALLAFLIISFSVVVTNQFLNTRPSYERSYLQSIASDAAAIIEHSATENLPEIVKMVPSNVCLKAFVQKYQGTTMINEKTKVTKGCPEEHLGETVIARTTYVDEEYDYYLITVKGWYKAI